MTVSGRRIDRDGLGAGLADRAAGGRRRLANAWMPVGGQRLALGLLSLVLIAGVALPFGALLLRSFTWGQRPSLEAYARVFGDPSLLAVVGRSVWVASASTLVATALGLGLALLVARSDLPGAGRLRGAFALPYFIPPFIAAVAWLQVIGPAGYLNKLWLALPFASEPLPRVYGPGGMILLLALHHYPLVYLSVLSALDRQEPALEQAAAVCGAGPLTVLRRVTLGLAGPALLAGTFLAFVAALADFGVAAVIGLPANYTVLSTRIYQLVRSFDQADNFAQAAALAALLLLFGLLALVLEYFWLGQRSVASLTQSERSQPLIRLGAARRAAAAGCWLFLGSALGLPLVAVTLTALTRVYGLPPVPENWTLDNFRQLLNEAPETLRAIRNSLLLAAGAATAIVALGLLTARADGGRRWGRLTVEFLTAVPYAVPGIVVGLAMVLSSLQLKPLLGFTIYNTIWIILVAYLARFLVFGVRTAGAALAQVDRGLLEAARVAGAGWGQTQLRIVWPLVRRSMLAGWLLIFVPALTELTVSILLWSAGNETIGVAVYNLQDHGNGLGAASLALLVMGLVLVGNWAVRLAAGAGSQESGGREREDLTRAARGTKF